MKQPYLIQRGTIKNSLEPEYARLSNAVDLSYMGRLNSNSGHYHNPCVSYKKARG